MHLATLITTVLVQADPWDHHGWDGTGSMWAWGALMMALWLGLIALVVWVIARRPDVRPTPPTDRAREILAERYARGEIDGDEYRERLEALR